MKKWQKRFAAIAVAMGLAQKVKEGSLTADEQKNIFSEYEKQHGVTFEADRQANEDVEAAEVMLSAEEQTSLAALLNVEPAQAPQTQQQAVSQLASTVATQQQQISALSNEPEPAQAIRVAIVGASDAAAVSLGRTPHTATHLFGLEHGRFAANAWYNELFVDRKERAANVSEEQRKDLENQIFAFGKEIGSRMQDLQASNQIGLLDFNKMVSGESKIDYSSLTGTAGEYIVRRTDLILAYFRSLPSVANIFPVVSNVQNKGIAPTANFGELSQGFRTGKVFKGSVKFAAEVYNVVSVMFKYQFSDLQDLEAKYIGYLNREGSDVIKWTFIEWIMVYFGRQLVNEQNIRRVEGVYVPQQSVNENPAKLAADGALRAIERVEEELKVLPFEDLNAYDNTDMLDYVASFWEKVVQILPSTDGYKFYANLKHKTWYIALWSEKYGSYTGFTGSNMQLPDLHPDNIVWVPNMSTNNKKMWITFPGNVENLEDKPGEMTAFFFQRDFDVVNTMSRWKEGANVIQPGVKYASKAELVASARQNQYLFTNWPIVSVDLAASISFAGGSLIKIDGTTLSGETDNGVTTVTGYAADKVYKLVAHDADVLLKKAGAFSKISADFNAGAAGDYIKVYAELENYEATVDGATVTLTRPTGKFLELSRSVTA